MNNINKKLTVFLTALMLSFSTVAFSFEGFSIGATYSSLDFDTTGTESAEGDIGTGLTKNTTSILWQQCFTRAGCTQTVVPMKSSNNRLGAKIEPFQHLRTTTST